MDSQCATIDRQEYTRNGLLWGGGGFMRDEFPLSSPSFAARRRNLSIVLPREAYGR